MKRWAVVFVFIFGGAACSSSNPGGAIDGAPVSLTDGGQPTIDGAVIADAGGISLDASVAVPSDGGAVSHRPYNFYVPSGYDANKPTPLLILLHGYSAWGELQDFYLNVKKVAEDQTFLYAYPDGTLDATGIHFWNATDACCNFYGSDVDDVAYIDAIIEDVAAHYNLDRDRVFLFGHSNGGFMSHRFACDRSEKIAAFAALAGDDWLDWSKCNPTTPVSVLQIHGDADALIHYTGGTAFPGAGAYPSAMGSVAGWAHFNSCPGALGDRGTLDLDAFTAGNETEMQSYPECGNGAEVSLWTIHGGGHVPLFTDTAIPTVWSWLISHPKIH
jgi:polyhydroxybutyrate depolymerase